MPGGERERQHRLEAVEVNNHFRADDAEVLPDGLGVTGGILDAHGQGAGPAKDIRRHHGRRRAGSGVTGMLPSASPWAA